MYKKPYKKGITTPLNDTEQSVILHISGYVLYQLKKKTHARDTEAITSLIIKALKALNLYAIA
ncbi:hypothetical protein DPMN_083703 [Dreissena polymorpha]|uniref:Uncharacterized protein n=1 Tax=Dreissena polymorpha TaxID=45954 RepID=A0A9D3Y996_DREPO|nr:hypothetical protein DPMN_083703 [Dreissena polymorpha]